MLQPSSADVAVTPAYGLNTYVLWHHSILPVRCGLQGISVVISPSTPDRLVHRV